MTTSDLMCILRYDDAPRAIDWLEMAFGFQRELVVPGKDGEIAFAQLRLGEDVLGTGTTQPELRNAVEVYVEDVDRHYEQARAAGAQITQDLNETEFGARIYGARDLAGHNWSFGTYRPEKPPGNDIFPVLGYQDYEQARDWLKSAFGFETRTEYTENGMVVHSELAIGYGLIMPSAPRPGDESNPWSNVNFGLYVCLEDIKAHHQRAKDAGAEIVRPLSDTDYGATEYSVRDVEGNLWSFGTYRPDGTRP